jgi:hypothetical protein
VAGLVMEYYVLLRTVLHHQPHLRVCRKRCRHCGIFFLTHPRNAGRHDLDCPFGCRQAHRRRQSTLRSVAYYRDPVGKIKKRLLNDKRRAPREPEERPPAPPVEVAGPAADPGGAGWRTGRWNEPMVAHVRMVSRLIEGRRVRRREVREMLERVLRQHRMVRRRQIDQAVAWIKENPP